MSRRVSRQALALMLVTDRGMAGQRPLEDIVLAAVRGGVTAVQLREKSAGTRAFIEFARTLDAALAPLGVPLVINDRVDVALAAGIANVHVGQSDMAPADVRRLMGPDATIGLSISDPGQMRAADLAAADYLGVGPVYPTGSKADAAPALGVAGLAGLRAMTGLPIIAIGGLTADNSGPVLAAGADGVAVVSALMLAADPAAAAASFRAARR